MDATERYPMFNGDMSHPNHQAQDVLLAAIDGRSGSDRQVSTVDEPPPAEVVAHANLDGGYGWVILTASFFVAFIVDGIGSSFGLVFPYIVAKFGSSAFLASFAGSTFVSFMIMGSISTVLVKKFGLRLVAVLASSLSCVAFVVSVFSPNIYVFIVTFGLLAGCSCGLVFIPSIIIVNEYFHQKRGIANGIISSGSGVGLLVLGPIITLLLDAYSLHGTVLFLAGVLLNMCVFSSLFRPPDHDQQHRQSLSNSLSTDNVDLLSTDNQPDMLHHQTVDNTQPDMLHHQTVDNTQPDMLHHQTVDNTQPDMLHHQTVDNTQPDMLHHQTVDNTQPECDAGEIARSNYKLYLRDSSHHQGDGGDFYLEYVLHHVQQPAVSAHLHQLTSADRHPHRHSRLQACWNSELRLNSTTMQHQHSYSLFDIPNWCQDKDRHQVLEYISQRYQHFGDHRRAHQSHRSSHRHSQSLSVDQASNCYLAGSIATLLNLHNSFVHAIPESGLKSIHSLDSTSSQPLNITADSTSSQLPNITADSKVISEKLLMQAGPVDETMDMGQGLLAPVQHHCSQPGDTHKSGQSVGACLPGHHHGDVSEESEPDLPLGFTMGQLLCMPSFHLFCLGAALIQIGYPLAGTFLPDYAYQFGLTTSHTAVLMSLLGGLNICGRLSAGCLVGLKVDPLFLNNLSLLLGGVACLLCPLYTEFWSLCVFACMFGFFLGFFPPLQPLIIVKHFGLDTLASAFGFLSTVKGVASIMGAPLAGFIYDVTRQYSMSFIFGGAVFVLSSLVHCLMTVSEKYCWRNNQL